MFIYFNILNNIIYFCDAKLNFQHHYSSIQCLMILPKSVEYADLLSILETFVLLIFLFFIYFYYFKKRKKTELIQNRDVF